MLMSCTALLVAIVVPTIVVPVPAIAVPAVAVPVPVMVVLNAAVLTIPVSSEIAPAVITRSNPSRGRVGHACPIAFMPFVMMSNRVPVAFDPNVIGAWTYGTDAQHAGRRWRSNSDSD